MSQEIEVSLQALWQRHNIEPLIFVKNISTVVVKIIIIFTIIIIIIIIITIIISIEKLLNNN